MPLRDKNRHDAVAMESPLAGLRLLISPEVRSRLYCCIAARGGGNFA